MAHDTEPDFKPRLDGPIRRNLGLILAVVAIIVVGPALTRVLESYRGVVLEVRDDQMFVGLMDLPPEWMAATDAEPGQIVAKAAWSWSPSITEATPDDRKLEELFERYALAYEGTVVEILPPPSQNGVTAAVVQTTDGRQQVVKLVADHLLGAAKGDKVAKRRYSWDPEIVEKAPAQDASGDGVSFTPPQPPVTP